MAQKEYETTPAELRRFALLQIGLTSAFCVLTFWILGDVREHFPPIWLVVVLLLSVAAAAFFAERVWSRGMPLNPADDADAQRRAGVGVFAAQTVRKLIICEAPLMLSVIVSFVTPWGGWPIILVAPIGIGLLAWEVWPSLRNVAMTEVMLNAAGAHSDIIEAFIDA